jgi:hypothetical protein
MEKEIAMSGKTFVALAVTSVLSVLGTAAMAGNDRDDHGQERGGAVVRCSLDGVNPALHPEVFGNPATALAYGFVQAPDRTWHVRPDCRR